MKTLLNRRKIPCISPLFHRNKYIVDSQDKSEIFISFFSFFFFRFSPISKESVLPSELPLRTDSALFFCKLKKDNIPRIINNVEPNKAHDHNKIVIRMLKICGDSNCRTLKITF